MVNLPMDDIINLYNNGYSMEAIGKIYNCSRNPIERLLKNKVKIKRGKPKLLSNEQEMEISNLYLNEKTIEELCDIYACSSSVILRILKNNDIFIRKSGPKIKYKTDINFFKEINCEANAYFLGFLYADGNISKKINTMTLHLQPEDEKILEIFKNLISPTSPIKKDKKGYVSLRICQTDIIKQLINLGCVPAKSLILEFPTCVPDHLIHHFLRGYSDGDGCISKYLDKRNHYRYSWDIVSTNKFCLTTQQLIKSKLNVGASFRYNNIYSKTKGSNITSRISIGGNLQLEKFLDWLYKDAIIYLERKYNKYIELKNYNQARLACGTPEKGDVSGLEGGVGACGFVWAVRFATSSIK